MAYKNNFVVAVKHQDKILREKDGVIMLPFGSEYSILLKNLDSRKAVVKVSIDGKDVLCGKKVIVEPNCSLELERFLDDLDEGNKFKFIKKTKEIIEHRGDRPDDGIIRVEFWFEKKTEERTEIIYHKIYKYTDPYWPWYPWWPYDPWWKCPTIITYPESTADIVWHSSTTYPCSGGGTQSSSYAIRADEQACCFAEAIEPNNDEGITVRGSKSYQKFYPEYTKELESQSSVITLKLRGVDSHNKEVDKAITVKDKIECPTCGKKCPSKDRYCSSCGTYLT